MIRCSREVIERIVRETIDTLAMSDFVSTKGKKRAKEVSEKVAIAIADTLEKHYSEEPLHEEDWMGD